MFDVLNYVKKLFLQVSICQLLPLANYWTNYINSKQISYLHGPCSFSGFYFQKGT